MVERTPFLTKEDAIALNPIRPRTFSALHLRNPELRHRAIGAVTALKDLGVGMPYYIRRDFQAKLSRVEVVEVLEGSVTMVRTALAHMDARHPAQVNTP